MATIQKLGESGFKLTCECGKHVVLPDGAGGYQVESILSKEFEAMRNAVAEQEQLRTKEAQEHEEKERKKKEEAERKAEEEKKKGEQRGHSGGIFGRK